MLYSLKIEQSVSVVFIPVYLVRKSDVETKHNTHTHTVANKHACTRTLSHIPHGHVMQALGL